MTSFCRRVIAMDIIVANKKRTGGELSKKTAEAGTDSINGHLGQRRHAEVARRTASHSGTKAKQVNAFC